MSHFIEYMLAERIIAIKLDAFIRDAPDGFPGATITLPEAVRCLPIFIPGIEGGTWALQAVVIRDGEHIISYKHHETEV